MSGKLLDIVIPTLNKRIDVYAKLIRELNEQMYASGYDSLVDIITFGDTKGIRTVGAKRQWLYEVSTGQYIMSMDDDDWFYPNSVKMLVKACMYDKDVVTFCGDHIDIPNNVKNDFIIKLGLKDINDTRNKMLYRAPNHICPVKRGIALEVGFPDKSWSEDSVYAAGINKLLKTEAHISDKIYIYNDNKNTSETRNLKTK